VGNLENCWWQPGGEFKWCSATFCDILFILSRSFQIFPDLTFDNYRSTTVFSDVFRKSMSLTSHFHCWQTLPVTGGCVFNPWHILQVRTGLQHFPTLQSISIMEFSENQASFWNERWSTYSTIRGQTWLTLINDITNVRWLYEYYTHTNGLRENLQEYKFD